MSCHEYIPKKFHSKTLDIINEANIIISEFQGKGFDLTLRQLYYQFIARGKMINEQRNYSNLSTIISDARLAGLIDWMAIVDRTRFLRELSHWDSPAQIIKAAANSYRKDKWSWQPHRIEVWIEKDALIGVIEKVCNKYDVPFFSCRGYVSQSEMWGAAQRIVDYQIDGNQKVHIFHLGDHDPSGIDMTRDIWTRLEMFVGDYVHTNRLALNMNQVEEFNPPPNPARLSDSRCADYVNKYGVSSWELDALEPEVMVDLIETNIQELLNIEKWDEATEIESLERDKLIEFSDNWN